MKTIRSSYKAKLSQSAKVQMAKLRAPVTITASAAEGDKPAGPPTFAALAYSGAPVPAYSLSKPLDADYIINLAGMSPAKNMRANLDHKSTQRVGHLTDYQNDGKQVQVVGALSAATPYREEVAGSAKDGYEWEVSIEANLSQPRKLAKGKSETINGRLVSGPLWIFDKSTLTALGFVSNGADEGNHVTIAATAAGAKKMNKFEEFCASCGVDLDHASDEQRARLQKLFDLEQAGTTVANQGKRSTFAEMAEEERRENARVDAIAKMGREALRENPIMFDQIKAFVDDAIESKMSVDKAELELLRACRSVGGKFNSRPSGTANDPKVIEAAICLASGLPDAEKYYNEATLEAVDRSGMRGFSVQQLLMQTASANGYTCRAGERITVGNIRSVLEHCFPPTYARLAGFSAASLPNILGAVANKMILSGYMESETAWKEFAEIKPVSNFYTQNHYRMLDSLEYEEVGSGGLIPHGTLGEETYTSRAKTYGKMLGLTREQIINDDLGAFNDIRSRLGRGAAKKFNNVFWAAFMNNSSFFTTALTNYIEGSTTNLGTDGVGLGLGVKQFRKMTTPSADGTKRVGVSTRPTKLLVPPELETIADALYIARNHDNVAVSSVNTHANKYRPIVENRLSDSAFTGYSATAWYLFSDEMKPMLVTFLNGNQTPIVESTDADFNTLGIQFRGYHDFGCDKSEYLAGLKSKGAA